VIPAAGETDAGGLCIPDVPVVDAAALDVIRELAADDTPELLARVVGLYLDDAPRHVAAIEAALARGDARALTLAAHTLKSASASMGAAQLAQLCRILEQDSRAGDLSRADALVGALRGAWSATQAVLGAAIR
jgi:HPt (histidine-containing phosphotransfer) domain-containing protein